MRVQELSLPSPLVEMARDMKQPSKNKTVENAFGLILMQLGRYLQEGGDDTPIRQRLFWIGVDIQKLSKKEQIRFETCRGLVKECLNHSKEWKELKDRMSDSMEKIDECLEEVNESRYSNLHGLSVVALNKAVAALKVFSSMRPKQGGKYNDIVTEHLAKCSKAMIWGLEDYFEGVMGNFDKVHKWARNDLGIYLRVLRERLPEIRGMVPDRPEFRNLLERLDKVEALVKGKSHLAMGLRPRRREAKTMAYVEKMSPKPSWLSQKISEVWSSEVTHGLVLFGFAFMLYNMRSYDFRRPQLQSDNTSKAVDQSVARLGVILTDKRGMLSQDSPLFKKDPNLKMWVAQNQDSFPKKTPDQLMDEYRVFLAS